MKARLLQLIYFPIVVFLHMVIPCWVLDSAVSGWDIGDDVTELGAVWFLPLWIDQNRDEWARKKRQRKLAKERDAHDKKVREREQFIAEMDYCERFLERNGVEIRIRQRDMEDL